MTPTKRPTQPLWPIPKSTDWDAVFDGGIYLFEKGDDYDCTSETYLSIIAHKAHTKGIELKTRLYYPGDHIDGNRVTVESIVIQARR